MIWSLDMLFPEKNVYHEPHHSDAAWMHVFGISSGQGIDQITVASTVGFCHAWLAIMSIYVNLNFPASFVDSLLSNKTCN